MDDMRTIEDVFGIWDTVVDLATDIEVPLPRAYGWRNRNSIPVKYWDSFISAAQSRGVTITTDDLKKAVSGEREAV